jgi:neutral ceramidase
MSIAINAGVGRADITPPSDMPGGIWKTQKHIRASGIHRPLYVTALALSDGPQTVLILSFDLCFLTPPQEAAILAAITDRTGLAAEQILLFVTHTHAPPLTQESYSGEGEDEVRAYVAALPGHAADAAARALHELTPAFMAASSGRCGIGVNRDLPVDGRVIVAPNPAGFSDPEVGVLRIDGVGGTALACLAIYGCHPHVLGPDNSLISPDYPGVMRDWVEAATGVPCLFLQGAGGNVGPVESFVADLAVAERLGQILACEVTRCWLETDTAARRWTLDHVIESAAPLGMMRAELATPEAAGLACVATEVALPIKDSLEERRRRLAEELDTLTHRLNVLDGSSPGSGINTARIARMRVSNQLARVEQALEAGSVSVQLRIVRAGDLALVGAGAEVFAELGVAIKRDSPFATTLFAAYLGQANDYLAPAQYYLDRPGYEVEYSPFAPEAADIFVEAARNALNRLHQPTATRVS